MIASLTAREMELDAAIEQALVGGDLSRLTIPQRLQYYKAVCASLRLNPLTKPFLYIELNRKLVLYPTGDCADQLRALHGVSIDKLEKKTDDGLYEVTAYASLPSGRKDQATGFVFIENLKGADRANAKMKTETKAKRRVTMSIVGLSGYAGIELTADETSYREVDVDHSPVITARADAAETERSARPMQEWVEELDEPMIEQNNEPAEPEPQPATSKTFFALANEYGIQKEAVRIANKVAKSQDWHAATVELQALLPEKQTAVAL